ncbi:MULTISPECIES: hypothetical protein [Myxococcus]|nr:MULTISPECIES: hypothetical protein [Myxococcus]QZZ54672.1 hypothetical protein MyxoNM_36105 [Myxococcus xanthus]UYI14300.1 hypothetical protein N3T43_35440 [Myxococcus xanthus]UYI21667.1 hypothetical protein N1129_35900 [Myxococcus xanthus]SDW11265.1 hypothetical protein SAMN05444383_101273 [Myxococcus xanthus]
MKDSGAMTEWMPKPNPAVDLRTLALSPEEGFVLSRLDGATSARNLPALTGLPPERLRTILSRLITQGALLPTPTASPAAPVAAPPVAFEPQRRTSPAAPEPEADLPVLDLTPLDAAPEADLPVLDLTPLEAAPAPDTAQDAEPSSEDEPEAALGNYRQLFELRLHPLPEDQRIAHAHAAEDPILSALCFDPVPAVIKAVLENARTGLPHARLVARYHRNPVGLEALCARAAFAVDTGVRRWLVRNPQLPASLFRRLWSARRLMELHKVGNDRDVPESTRRAAREVLRQRFASGPAEEKVELILNTEGRALAALIGLPVDGKTASLLCGRTYRSPMLIQNIARWSAAPPALIAHLLKQEAVRRQPQLRMLLARHPNAPADAKRGGA